jgi:hypothetical protein
MQPYCLRNANLQNLINKIHALMILYTGSLKSLKLILVNIFVFFNLYKNQAVIFYVIDSYFRQELIFL